MQGIDMHTHSRYSFDSFFEPEDQCEAALQVGLGGLCFTEHFSMDELDVSYDFLEYSQYRQAITNCQQKYKGRLWIGCGLEIGEPHLNKCCQQLDKARQNMDLDFVIGSVHNIGSVTLIDYLKAGRSKDEYYHDYFAEVLQMVQVADIDVVGHLDLAARYGFDEIGDYNFEQYKPVLTKILSCVIDRDLGIEVNTSGWRNSVGRPYPNDKVLMLYKALGGKRITIGSDGHNPIDIGSKWQRAYALLRKIGFEYVYVFMQRQPVEIGKFARS